MLKLFMFMGVFFCWLIPVISANLLDLTDWNTTIKFFVQLGVLILDLALVMTGLFRGVNKGYKRVGPTMSLDVGYAVSLLVVTFVLGVILFVLSAVYNPFAILAGNILQVYASVWLLIGIFIIAGLLVLPAYDMFVFLGKFIESDK